MTDQSQNLAGEYDAVEPPHYRRGPMIHINIGENITKGIGSILHPLQCIEVMRHILDPRLATAFKYIWRVAFGGKREPWDTRTQREVNHRDISSAIWFLQDWLKNPSDAGHPQQQGVQFTPSEPYEEVDTNEIRDGMNNVVAVREQRTALRCPHGVSNVVKCLECLKVPLSADTPGNCSKCRCPKALHYQDGVCRQCAKDCSPGYKP